MNVFDFIIAEEANYKTNKIPVTNSVDWNMHDHIQRCTNVANGWYSSGKNDGIRPYKDIVTPVLNVALRSQGFDVKDIIPYVDSAKDYYKSFLIKKYHPKWAKKHQLDTFIDEVVYSSIVYDLVLVKNVNKVRPEVVPLQQIAFCDQTNIESGPICLKHQYSITDLLDYKGRWDSDRIDEAILMAKNSKKEDKNGKEAKTPGKYIEVYELHDTRPETDLYDNGDPGKYVKQVHIVTFYKNSDDNKVGITLFKGPEKKSVFRSLVTNPVYGRACGRSLVESLFEPQVWANYSEIKMKEMIDAAAIILLQTDSDELGNQKLSDIKNNRILKHEQGKPVTRVDNGIPQLATVSNYQIQKESDARILGSASEAQLGLNPVSGTPLGTTQTVVQQGEGIHSFKRGKIATFFSDVLYPDWILGMLVQEMNKGKTFSGELTLEELNEIAEAVSEAEVNKRIKEAVLSGKLIEREEIDSLKSFFLNNFKKGGNRKFFEILQDELEDVPVVVYVNVAGKQRYMAQNADKLSNILKTIMSNPQAFSQVPGLAKLFNELLEESGMSAIDFAGITKAPIQATAQPKLA